MKLCLNVGSGSDIRKSDGNEKWINLDQHNRYKAEYIFDLNEIFSGKRMKFKDNTFDHVYCSHVIEDWSYPRKIIDELVRVTKEGGLIEIRVPFETNTWGSIDHVRGYNKSTFISYINKVNYDFKKPQVFVKELKYYQKYSSLKSLFPIITAFIFNIIPRMIIEGTLLKYFCPCMSVKVIYQKVTSDGGIK